jgi:hypothetical protein
VSNFPLREGQVLTGSLFNEPMRVETVQANGPSAWLVGVVGLQTGLFRRVTLTPADVAGLTVLESSPSHDGDGTLLRLGLQAYAFGIAYELTRRSAAASSGSES